MEESKTAIGSKIRSIRELKNISLEDMAEMSKLNAQYLNAIEEDSQVPSIGELIKIVRVLGVRVGTILDDFTNEGPVVSRAKEREATPVMRGMKGGNPTMSYFSLSSRKQDRHMETYAVNLPQVTGDVKLSSHEGEEFVYVLEGEVEILYGKEKYNLGKGDSIYYDSIIPHHVGATSPEGAKTLAVVYIPA
ncbi:MAG: cupin domain-containing protein [Bacteroidales bacterium]|nr:cupin domain-containing protein [Bacteroidales bacterium]